MKKRVLLLGLVVLMVLTGCGTTEKETKTKEKDPDKLVLNIGDKKEDNIQEEQTDMQEQASQPDGQSQAEEANEQQPQKNGHLIAIDAGHQARGNFATEPVGPGSSTRKAKVAGGATGVASHVPEYKLTLAVSKKLQKELKARGYKVYMIRTKNNVNISNKKRAQLANKSGADIYIRIHADSSNSRAVTGASGLYPSKANRYVSKLSAKSKKLSSCLLKSYCKKTKIRNRGLVARDDLTGTNWSKIPVSLIEMGFLSNPSEDRKMQKSNFQTKMAKGIADGIDAYFK